MGRQGVMDGQTLKTVESELSQKSRQLQRITPILIFFSWAWAEKPIVSAATAANNPAARRCPASHPPELCIARGEPDAVHSPELVDLDATPPALPAMGLPRVEG